jgi:hypothetical protein
MILADEKQREIRQAREVAGEMPPPPAPDDYVHYDVYDLPPAENVVQSVIKLESPYVEACERELLGFILEDGCSELQFDIDSKYYSPEPVTVADFIDGTLADGDLVFLNSSYDKAYEAYFALYQDGLTQQQIQQRLLNNIDEEIAAVAKEILIEKYEITVKQYEQSMTARSTVLAMFVPKSLLAYQCKRVDLDIRVKNAEHAATQDMTRQMELLTDITSLNKIRTMLNNELGRV